MKDQAEDANVNYKEMYLTMLRATEKAMNILIEAQQKCEDMYIEADGESQPFSAPSDEGAAGRNTLHPSRLPLTRELSAKLTEGETDY